MSDFRVRIQAELDAKNLTAQLNAIQNSKIKIPVELDIKNADFQKALSSLTNTNNKIDLNVDTSGIKSGIDATEKLKTSALQLNKFKFKIDTGGLSAELSKIDSQINRFNRESMTKDQRKQIDAIVDSYRDLDKIVDDVSKKNESGALDSEDINKYNTALKTTQNQIKILSNELSGAASATDRIKLTSQMQVWLNENTNATKEARAEIERYIQEINSLGDSMTKGQFNDYSNSFKQINSEMQALGKTGKSWASDFKRAFGQIAQFATAYGIIQNVLMDVPRQMVQSVMDVDSAMTDLQMATGVTDEQAKSLMSTYSELGDQLKATSTDIAASSTEWLNEIGHLKPL